MTSSFNNFTIKDVISSVFRDLMAERLDNSENWMIGCPMLGKGKPNDLVTKFGFIVYIIWESLDDKT